MFTEDLLEIFHDDEADDTYARFTHLQQTRIVIEYTHVGEVLAIIFANLTNDQLLKMYILGLKHINM